MFAQLDKSYFKLRPYKVYARLISYFFFEGRPATTKGRWFNRVIVFIFRILVKLPFSKKVKKPIFILGIGRSGTTVLGIILSKHREVGYLNEPKLLWHFCYPHEDIIGSYTASKGLYHLDESNFTETTKKSIHKLYGSFLRLSFSKRIVDKYPELVFRVPYVLSLFPDAKFIFLCRNGIDASLSIENWSSSHTTNTEHSVESWWGVNDKKWNSLVEQIIKPDPYYAACLPYMEDLTDNTNRAALEWIANMRAGLKFSATFPEVITKVRYEDLLENPAGTLEEIATFCELSPDKKFITYGEQILTSKGAKKEIQLLPEIQTLFDQTMISLGY